MSEVMKKNDTNLTQYRPATDILEREDGFYIYMDLPGVAKDALVIDLQEDELTVTGTTSYDLPEGETFTEMQFGNGQYRRTVSLSDIVDRERIRANLKNGVLELFLPRVEKTQPKRIQISQG
ncbi:Hsp20/alpha crystallin family protein [Salidesulfovibrio onnuriiensis]|uniref:Hsp20/alpha crystallin family protein n=1 Tax=Salidesulfovibrio onnuriiensis TaxID=2583823 RepID=UPI0011C7F3EE|nr:Hsp20/alpha crystallin family protein [Salidesulfovibrio onnuriiensis]